MAAISAAAAGAVGSSTSGGALGTAGAINQSMLGGSSFLQAGRDVMQSRSSNAMTQAQQAAQQAQADVPATPELSPEEQAIEKQKAEGGTMGNVSLYGNIRNGVNAEFSNKVANEQKEFENREPVELANPLGTPLEPMGAVGGMASAITGGVLPQNGSPFTGQAQMNAGQMFGQTYGGMFAGASKKIK